MIDEILFQHLDANVDLDGRVYAYLLPQDAEYPAVAYLQVSESKDYDFSGEVAAKQSRYQISIFAKTYLEARNVADAVKAAMQMPITGIDAALMLNCSPSYESDLELYHISLDYQIHSH